MQRYKKYKHLLPERIYHFIDVIASYQGSVWEELEQRYEVCRLNDTEYLLQAMQLHAEVYLERGYVVQEDIEVGIISARTDPHQSYADYFGVVDKQTRIVIATARQIRYDEGHTIPIFKHLQLRKDYSYIDPREIVEISAFTKRRGADSKALLLLFHEMFSYSKSSGHRFWLMAVDKKVYARLKTIFGPVMRRVGPEMFYMGSDVIPAEIELDQAERLLQRAHLFSLPPLRGIRRFLRTSFPVNSGVYGSRAAFWNAYAKAYDGLLTFMPYKHLIDHVSDVVLSYTPRNVLDLGCGTGNVTAALTRKSPTLCVDAVDWSRAMLEMLPKKIKDKNVVISRSDILTYLEKTDKKYDVIVMNNVLYTISDRRKLWCLLKSHLVDGGRIVVANPDTPESSELIKNHVAEQSFGSLLRPSLAAVWVFDSLISLNTMDTHYDFSSRDVLLEEIDAAGLSIDGEVGRCYGGHERGIDLLFSVKIKAEAV